MVFAGTFSMLNSKASTGFEVISPFPEEHFALINDTELITNISVYAPGLVGATVNLAVTGPYDIEMTSAGIPIGSIGSTGYLNLTNYVLPTTLFEANGTPLTHFIPGEYNFTISVGLNHATVPVYFTSPNEVEMVVSVYSNGQPLQGVTVDVYNETSSMFLVSNTTDAQGVATLTVPYVYTMTNTYNVTATKPGYKEVYTTVTVPPDQISAVSVKLTTSPVTFVITPYYFEDEGIQEPTVPTVINGEQVYVASGFEGTTLSMIINATESGVPISGATITGKYSYFVNGVEKTSTSTATYIGNGMYNLSIMLPVATNYVPYTVSIAVTGSYQSSTYSFVALVSAEANYIGIIEQLNSTVNTLSAEVSLLQSELSSNVTLLKSDISSLNSTIMTLESELSSLNSTVNTLKSELASVNSTLTTEVNSLESKVSTLSSEVSSLNSEVSSLNTTVSSDHSSISSLSSKVNSMSTLEYAALGIAIVGLIVAIVAIVLVFRKVA
ncbi:hypothetical protein B6F84_03430 [Acidianus manzaensis]|uniref:Uncharacterized protein n=2 Tax=Acidianus manzaensis TaxID=282676 RepID=A0A1W6JY50_9CREN|nr:hypothetical protein B6F84_03430 [Acidianus manzaensis]